MAENQRFFSSSTEMSSHGNVAEMPLEPPRFIQPLQSVVAVEGGSVCFEAILTGFPRPEVRWYHGNDDVTKSVNYEISYGVDGRTSLHIPEVFDEDAGQFVCKAFSDLGQASSTAELVVQTTTVPPDFILRLANITVAQGTPVCFQVRASGIPTPRVKWYREGAEIRNSGDFQIRCEGDLYSLTIVEACEEDTGRFTVTASNQGGKATSTAVLTVSGDEAVTIGRMDMENQTGLDQRQMLMTSRSELDEMSAVKRAHEYEMQRTSVAQEQRTGSVKSSEMSKSQTMKTAQKQTKVKAGIRRQSPSPIRSVRMSPPVLRRSKSPRDKSASPMRKVHSVQAPSPTRKQQPATPTTPVPAPWNIEDSQRRMMASANKKETVTLEAGQMQEVTTHESFHNTEQSYSEAQSFECKTETISTYESSQHTEQIKSSENLARQVQESFVESNSRNVRCVSEKLSAKSSSINQSASAVSFASSTSSSSLEKPPAPKKPFVAPVRPVEPLNLRQPDETRAIAGVRRVNPPSSQTKFISHQQVTSTAVTSHDAEQTLETVAQTTETDEGVATYPPFIKTGMQDMEVTDGEMTILQCEVMGNPVPHVAWYREGSLIESSHDFEITYNGQVSCLLIREAFADDAGRFTCSATNEQGTTSCSCFLKVKPVEQTPKAGKLERNLSASETELSMTDYDGFESTEAELDFVSGVSEAELTDTELTKPAQHAMDGQDLSYAGATMLSPVAEETSTPSGKSPEKRAPQEGATAYANGQPPRFIKTPASMMKMEEGSAVRLECVIAGVPPPQVTWAKNGALLQTSHRFKVIEDTERHLYCLMITMVFPEDVGEYTITATNQFGFISGSVMLVSEEHYQRFQEQDAIDRQSADEDRQSTGTPTAQAYLPPRGRGTSASRGRGDRRRGMTSPGGKSPGDLRKTSSSPSKRLREISTSPIRGASPSKRLDELDQLDIEKYFKPKFLKKPENCECNEGQATRIDCKVTGRPFPDVTFYKNGSQVYEDFSHRIVVKEDGVRSLIISPARPEDSGEYTVIAKSAAGKAISTMSLTVIPQEGLERPRILEKPQSVSVKEGDMVRLEVFAVGRPTPDIVWLKDNVLLIPDKHPDMRIEGVDGHGLLTIEQASKGLHDAWYTATAVNKTGRDLTRCKVNVERLDSAPEQEKRLYIPKAAKKRLPVEPSPERVDLRKLENFDESDLYDSSKMQKPRIKKKLVSVKQKILGAAHFECHIVPIGDPTMKVEWLLDGKPLEYANRIMTTFEFGYAALDISAVYPRDTGVVSCRCTNSHGQVQSSCTLIVKEEKGLVVGTQLPDTGKLEKINTTEKHRQALSLAHDHPEVDDTEVRSAPKIVLAPDALRVQEGEPARFRARVLGSPLPKVTWYLNETSIRPSKRFRIWSDGIHYFEIATVRGYDHGTVRMEAENIEGKTEITVAIEVCQAEDMRSVLHKAQIPKGKTDVKTSLDTNTLKQYRINRNVEEQVREEKGKQMITLREVEKPIAGIKKLKKVERHEELQSKFSELSEEERMLNKLEADKKKVDLPADTEAPVVIERVHNLTVQRGSDASFRVRFHAKPEPEISWYRNEIRLEESDRVSWFYPEDKVCELIIRNTTTDDSGSISVRISNIAGQAGSQGFLLVQETKEALCFTEELHDITAHENDKSAIFECSLSDPKSQVQWYFRSESGATERALHDGEKYQTQSDGSGRFLRVSSIALSDSGSFSCVVMTEQGEEMRSTAQLSVEAVPKKILSGLKDETAREGTPCYFTVVVSHQDVSGVWLKDGHEIETSAKFSMGEAANKRTLTVTDVRKGDEGVYEYVFSGSTTKARLNVEAMTVEILKQPKDQVVFAGDVATFEVKVSRDNASGTWTHNGSPVASSKRIIATSDRNKHILIIESASHEDSGTYTFSVGGSEATANLQVKVVNIADGVKNVNTVESNDATFECKVNQANYSNGKWLHNGQEIKSDGKRTIQVDGKVQRLVVHQATSDDKGSYCYVTGSDETTEASLEVASVEIAEALRDVSEAETAAVELTVTLSRGGVKGVWFKNGQRLKESANCSLSADGARHIVSIRSLSVEDQGTYEFRAGSKSCSAQLSVQGAQITKPLADQSVLETETAVLECEVAHEGVQGKWLKNGKAIEAAYTQKYESSAEGRIHKLVISNVSKQEAATYAFKFGSASTTAKLEVKAVKFAKGLRNMTVAEGSDAIFSVEIANDDVTGVMWQRNGVTLRSDDVKYQIEAQGNVHTLKVLEISKNDEAVYSCLAGSAKTSSRLYIEVVEIIRKLTEVRAMERRTVELTSEVNNDNAKGVWLKDGVPLQEDERVQIFQQNRLHKLVINNARPTDTGSYQFKAGRSTSTTKVTVEEVHVTSRMSDTVVKETQTATFECVVSHDDVPASLCNWFRNGEPLQSGENVTLSVDGRVHRLTVRSCSSDDTAEYSFVAGKDKCTARLDVQVVAIVKSLPKTVQATSSEAVVLECALDSTNINAYWTKDGQRIDSSREHSVKYESKIHETVHSLKVKDLTAEDAGLYTFVAGSQKSSTTLYVEVVTVDITKSVKNVEVVENKRATLEFQVNKPNVKAQWFKNGIQLDMKLTKRLKYEVDDLTHRLVVDDVRFDDAGEYTFQTGKQRATTYLYVQPPEAPKFVQELRNCIVIAGEAAKFTVRCSGRPIPVITWYKEGVSIAPSFKYKLLHDEDQYTLVVVEAEPSDSGEYVCEAKNEVGTFRTSATLQVDSKEQMKVPDTPDVVSPTIVEPMQDFITREGQSARFQCKIGGTNPKVTWSRDGKRIKPSRYFKISEYNGIYQLEVTEAYPEDEGSYAVTASNSQGQVTCSATLRLDRLFEQPSPESEPEDMQRQEGFMRDECDANNRLHVRSSMTGKEFTIQRSEVSRLVGNYITQSDIDPSLNDTPILSRTKQIKELDDDLIRPSFIQKPKIQSVLSEAHARFDCLFVASPRPSVVWLHSDAEIKANSAKYKTTLERDMFSYQAFLEIQSCQSNDAGTYKVVVRNREGEATASVPLVVTERSNVELPHTDTTSSHRKSEMKLNLDSMTHLDSGNEGLLPRTNGATPRQPYSPRKYYERRARGGRTSSLSEPSRTSSSTPCGRTHSLSRSSEMEQSMSSISTLSSLSGGSPPQDKLSMLQSDQEASDQGDIESPITHSSRQSCIKTQISNEGLSVALFRRDDTDTSGIETLHSSRTSVKRDHSVSPLKNSNRGVPPVVISELPENVSVNTGDAISLTCSVSGRPRPKVLWMRDAEDVRNAAHYSFEEALRSTEDKLTYDFMLSLVDAQREHSGTYTLSAFNLYGDVTSHTLLSVVDHMSKEEPNCNASNNDEYLERGCETLEDQSESDQNCVIDSDILVTEDETNAQLYSNNELEFEMGNGIRKILRSSECTKIDAEETLNLSITELTNETLEFRDDNKPETELFILSDDEKLECDKIAQNLQETGDVYIQTRIETNSPVNCSARCEESGLDGNTTFQHEPKGEICKASRFTVTKVENHMPNNLEDSVPTSTNNKETEYLSDSSEIEPPQELVTPIEDTNIIITEEQTEKPTKSIGYLGRIPTIEVEPVEDESNISEDLAESSDNETISDQSPLPYFTQELKNVTVLEGSNVELQCTTAFDDLKITWYKNAEQIINGRDGYFVESKDGHHRLTILDARWSEDEGIFTCQAETSTDVICTTSEVYVEMTKEKLYKILDFQQPTSTVTDENTSLDSTPELPQEQTNENLDDSIYHSAEESLDHFENSEDFMERHELSPILEEEEECISRASSSVRLSTEQISTSAQNPSIIFRRSSYDSLASFEAHEKLVASLPADALRIESDKPNETNTCPSDDSDEEYLEGACPSRASSACRPLAFTPDDMATRCRDFSDNEGGSRPGSVNSRRSLWRKGSKSDSFDLARCLEMDEESDATMTDNNYMSCDDDELLFTLDCHSDDNMPPVPENSSPVDDTLPAEIDNFPSTNNEEPVCETPACSYQDTVEHIVETTPVRTLSMDVLQPYTATIVKNEPLVEEESNERDELADEFLGYRYERSRADSVFDLKSLHERVKGLDVTESRRSSEGFESNESSEPCEDLCVDVNGNLKIVPAIEVREAPDSGEELIIPSPESLRSFPRRDIKSPVGKRGLTLDDVIRISAPAFDAVSSIADDFYSCVSSTATTPTCGFRTDECPSETGYQTPPEKANRPTELKYFETGSEDKETEYEDCSTPVNSPGHSEQTTATASGFETPPKFYYVIPPKFLGKKSIQITVMRGGCAIIACSVISHPEAKVAWYKDGRLMDIYNRVSQHIYNEPPKEWSDNFGNQGNWRPDWLCQLEDRDIGCPQQLDVHYVLKIQHLVPRDGGLYICKAWNSAGVATRIIRLSVE